MYKISKFLDDGRKTLSGFTLPDGVGHYYIVEMSFENHQQLLQIAFKERYNVEECIGTPGYYNAEGCRIDETSVIDVFCRPNAKPDAQIEVLSEPVDHVVIESRDELHDKLVKKGIRPKSTYGAQMLKEWLNQLGLESQPRSQPSLKIG